MVDGMIHSSIVVVVVVVGMLHCSTVLVVMGSGVLIVLVDVMKRGTVVVLKGISQSLWITLVPGILLRIFERWTALGRTGILCSPTRRVRRRGCIVFIVWYSC